MRITFLPSTGEDFVLLGTMLMRWGHEIVSMDNGTDLVVVSNEAYKENRLPVDLVNGRRCLLLADEDTSDDEIPHGWERLPKRRALDDLARIVGYSR